MPEIQMVQYQHSLAWKEFNLNLDSVKAAIAALSIAGFAGLSASESELKADFSEVPSDESKAAIDAYWAGLTDESSEATSYYSRTALQFALIAARADAATKAYDDLSVQQKKLIAGTNLSESDNLALIAAFPES